ncbi:MAG: hypothetical protein RJA22_2680 [Verrucomicrobiota bacterium]
MTPDFQIIADTLNRVARRRRAQRALAGLARGLLAGSVLLFLALGAFLLFPIPARVVPAAAVAGGLLALGGLVRGGWNRPTPLETARWVDDQRQLRERLSTALELHATHGPAPGEWESLLLRDAAGHAKALRIAELVPFRIPAPATCAALVLALTGALAFVPAYRTPHQRQRAQEQARLQETGRELAAVTRRELARRPTALPPTEKSLQQAAALGDRLSEASLTRAEALQDLARVTDQVAAQQRALEQNPALQPLAKAARETATGGGAADPNELRRRLDQLQQQLGATPPPPAQLDALQQSLEKARQQAAGLPAPGTAGHEQAKAQMAQTLADLARQAAAAGAGLADLKDAMQALASANPDQVLRELAAAAQDLDKLRQMAQALQQLQQQAGPVGRNLAEQLDKGQAQAAARTLQQMADRLQQGNLTREQLSELQRDLAQAIDPARDYGKVRELLERAAAQCQGGDRPGASQNLAQARAELQKLLEQAADAEALNAALDALARADQAIRSGQPWSAARAGRPCSACGGQGCGQCDGQGLGWGRGGGRQPGGVGTWTDDYGWTYFEETGGGPVNNGGIQRPDLDPRGLTDRPANLNPNLTPDKVRGRISPGAPMPSITLKGVHLRGTSNVRFEEAATTAQQEAQNALNQDKVPRAYQNAVRDYFDDLKQ